MDEGVCSWHWYRKTDHIDIQGDYIVTIAQ